MGFYGKAYEKLRVAAGDTVMHKIENYGKGVVMPNESIMGTEDYVRVNWDIGIVHCFPDSLTVIHRHTNEFNKICAWCKDVKTKSKTVKSINMTFTYCPECGR